MRLSVVIPLYNCAPVIERCLDSIGYVEGAEIIVVDDGSTDQGCAVVKKYAAHHPWIKLLRQDNGGVSCARNKGIETAVGDYIAFVDADDYLACGGLTRVVELAERQKADVLKYKLLEVSNDTQPNFIVDQRPIKKELIIGKGKALEGTAVSDFHVVDGLFRRTLLLDNNIRFHSDLCFREDDVFMAEVYSKACRVVSTDLPLYCYVVCSDYSHTHRMLSDERVRKIVDSELLAVQYRFAAVNELNNPTINTLERLKAMRYVFSASMLMLKGPYSFEEYTGTLDIFHKYGCFPLRYCWMKVSMGITCKRLIITFLCNHPWLAWRIMGINNDS